MANVLAKIKELANSSGKESKQIDALFILMREFNWTIKQIEELPIPTMQIMFEQLKKESKRNNKKTRGKR